MKTNVVEKGQWARELAVEVEAERIEAELTKAYRDYQKRVEIPGFRKGKVPLRMIKARYGESIRDKVIYDMLPDLVREATTEAGLVTAAPPSITELNAEPGQDLKFTARLDIWPEIDVQHYEGLEVTRTVHQVSDEEIDRQLQELRERHATERSVDRPLQKGDVLVAELQRLDEADLPIIGERFEERRFILGREDASSPEFEEALLGMSVGEERNVRFSYRETLPDDQRAGTRDHFLVKAREIHERILPDLDDEFAKDVGEQFATLDDLKAHIREQTELRWGYMRQQRFRAELMDRLIVANRFEVPESMVLNYVRSIREQRARSREGQDADADAEPTDEEKRYAERQLRRHLLMEGLRKKLDVQVADEEVEEALRQRAEEYGAAVEDLKRSGRLDDLRRELEETKIFDLLASRAKITEESI